MGIVDPSTMVTFMMEEGNSDSIIELIIRYSGDIEQISNTIGFTYISLLSGFAIINIKLSNIDNLIDDNRIIYIEAPKKIVYQDISREYNISCMSYNSYTDDNLYGDGIVVAIIDSGIDLTHEAFENTRVLYMWDQTEEGNAPIEYGIGNEYVGKEYINNDFSSHGTGVAGIVTACVPNSELLIVKLRSDQEGVSNTASLMLAIDYCIKKAINLVKPMVINLSYGNNYGDHAGNSIVEEYIDANSNISKLTFVVGTGNEGRTSKRALTILGNVSFSRQEIFVDRFNFGYSIQVWSYPDDRFDLFLVTPCGEEFGPINDGYKKYIYRNMVFYVVNSDITTLNPYKETFILIASLTGYVSEGIWQLRFRPKSIYNGQVNLWLPVADSISSDVFFVTPNETSTLTIPSTAKNIISVGAYNSNLLSYAPFSGRGFSINGQVKPDIVAPGVSVNVPVSGGGYIDKSGTSFATPFVSAGAAKLMQWGIIEGNDAFLYGNKLRQYLQLGARKLPGYSVYPNIYVGYGALCVSDSIKN